MQWHQRLTATSTNFERASVISGSPWLIRKVYQDHRCVKRIACPFFSSLLFFFEAAYVEMTWAFLGIWSMALYALKQLHAEGINASRLSFAKLIRAFQRMMRDYALPGKKNCKLSDLLLDAVIDEYERGNKTSRDYPRKKQERPPGSPKIRPATKQEIALAKQIAQQKSSKKGLTA